MSTATATPSKSLLSPEEVAGLLGVSPITLRTMRLRHSGPPYIQVSARMIRYPAAGLREWVAAQLINPEVRPDILADLGIFVRAKPTERRNLTKKGADQGESHTASPPAQPESEVPTPATS